MKIAASSQTALLAVAGVLVVLGGMMLSPEGSLLAFAVSGLLSLFVLLAGDSRVTRIVALVIIIAAALLSISAWRKRPSSFDRYRESAATGAPQIPVAPDHSNQGRSTSPLSTHAFRSGTVRFSSSCIEPTARSC
jgi:hypothetical protein